MPKYKVSRNEHKYARRFSNHAVAIPLRDERKKDFPEYYWAIRQCRWTDDNKIDMRGNPHFHVLPQPHRKKNDG